MSLSSKTPTSNFKGGSSQKSSGELLRQKSSTKEGLVRQRTIQLGNNSKLYLEYINILGNPSIVEKYLSETVRLKPVVRKPRERVFGEMSSLTSEQQLIRFRVSVTNTKIHQFMNYKNQMQNVLIK